MHATCGVLIIHGIGNQQPNYARSFISSLQNRIKEKGANIDSVEFTAVHWQPIFSKNQEELITYSKQKGLGWSVFRNIFIEILSDASSYHASYNILHRAIYGGLCDLEKKLISKTSPIIIIAHSQGAAIVSDYIYDRINNKNTDIINNDTNQFHHLKSLDRLITLGANIPLFRMGYAKPTSFIKPNENFIWENYYNKSDILGFPLHDFYEAPENKVKIIDTQIRVGSYLTKWNPFSHVGYWNNKFIIDKISVRLTELLSCK